MVSTLIRRPLLVQSGGTSSPTPIYTLAASTTEVSYDTGVKLFDTPKSFTILCQAYVNIYPWQSVQTMFGLDTGWRFRVGRVNSGNPYYSNVVGTASSYYCALTFNNTATDPDTQKCRSMYSRGSNAKSTKRIAVRYDHTTHRVEGNAPQITAPGTGWWLLSDDISTEDTIKLNVSIANGCRIDTFVVYNDILSDAAVNDFLNDGVVV